jgi:hypothetical protein
MVVIRVRSRDSDPQKGIEPQSTTREASDTYASRLNPTAGASLMGERDRKIAAQSVIPIIHDAEFLDSGWFLKRGGFIAVFENRIDALGYAVTLRSARFSRLSRYQL